MLPVVVRGAWGMRHHTTTAALLVLLCGCTGKETEPAANSRQITASSRMDATADVVDDKLRFELARPGPGWKMLHRRDAAAWHPGVVAGALSPGTLVGTVSVYQSDDAAHELAEAVCARIFEPFYTTKERGAGSGLGLSTAHGIIEQSGGALSIDSQPNRGTKMRFCLPATQEDYLPREREVGQSSPPSRCETILDRSRGRGLNG